VSHLSATHWHPQTCLQQRPVMVACFPLSIVPLMQCKCGDTKQLLLYIIMVILWLFSKGTLYLFVLLFNIAFKCRNTFSGTSVCHKSYGYWFQCSKKGNGLRIFLNISTSPLHPSFIKLFFILSIHWNIGRYHSETFFNVCI
jgi:hypothetical protein